MRCWSSAIASDAILQLNIDGILKCLDVLSSAVSSECVLQSLVLLGIVFDLVPSLREVVAHGKVTGLMVQILKEKAADGLISSEVAIQMIKICCCKSTVCSTLKKRNKVNIENTNQELVTKRRDENRMQNMERPTTPIPISCISDAVSEAGSQRRAMDVLSASFTSLALSEDTDSIKDTVMNTLNFDSKNYDVEDDIHITDVFENTVKKKLDYAVQEEMAPENIPPLPPPAMQGDEAQSIRNRIDKNVGQEGELDNESSAVPGPHDAAADAEYVLVDPVMFSLLIPIGSIWRVCNPESLKALLGTYTVYWRQYL